LITSDEQEEKVMKKMSNFVAMSLVFVLLMTGCSGKIKEKNLLGSWYRDGREDASFILYDDGTCEIDGEYGTGTWSIVNDNQLKLTNFYGETETATIDSVKNGSLILEGVEYSNTAPTQETVDE
jgi:hypothetical protein